MTKTQAAAITRAADGVERIYSSVAPTLHTLGDLGDDRASGARCVLLDAVKVLRELAAGTKPASAVELHNRLTQPAAKS